MQEQIYEPLMDIWNTSGFEWEKRIKRCGSNGTSRLSGTRVGSSGFSGSKVDQVDLAVQTYGLNGESG